MGGIWIAVMAFGLVAVGVAAQLGWALPLYDVKRTLDRRRIRSADPEPLVDDRGPVVRPSL